MHINCVGVAFTVGLVLVSLSSEASAEPPFTQQKAQVSGHLGYGAWMGDGDLNAYGVGLGVRGGVTLDPPIYVGALFDFFFGETDKTTVPLGGSVEESANAWLIQGEIGYDIGVSPSVVLRPKAGLGVTQISVEACVTGPLGLGSGCTDDSDGEFSFALGLEVPIAFNGVFVAPEGRFNIVNDASGFILAVGAGATF